MKINVGVFSAAGLLRSDTMHFCTEIPTCQEAGMSLKIGMAGSTEINIHLQDYMASQYRTPEAEKLPLRVS
jgi:hypothetical protein